jgi:hypothetical protein
LNNRIWYRSIIELQSVVRFFNRQWFPKVDSSEKTHC